jgi:hypothetical protein
MYSILSLYIMSLVQYGLTYKAVKVTFWRSSEACTGYYVPQVIAGLYKLREVLTFGECSMYFPAKNS